MTLIDKDRGFEGTSALPSSTPLKMPTKWLRKDANDPARLTKKLDIVMIVGCMLASSQFLGPIGVPMMIVALVLLHRIDKAGRSVRPWIVTIFALTILLDTGAAWVGWALDFFPTNHTILGGLEFQSGYGHLFDGAYYIKYNSTWLGGTPVTIEKMWEFFCIILLYPIRMVGAWGFLKMKRWGFQVTVITMWMYALVWLAYMWGMQTNWSNRMGSSQYGLVGYWIADLFYASCFVLLPWFYFVNREAWTTEGLDGYDDETPSVASASGPGVG